MLTRNGELKLYIGIPEDDGTEYLYLDLAIPNREIQLWRSKNELNGCSGADFLRILMDALNEATLYVRSLGIQVVIDVETIQEMADDFSDRETKEIFDLIKEMKE